MPLWALKKIKTWGPVTMSMKQMSQIVEMNGDLSVHTKEVFLYLFNATFNIEYSIGIHIFSRAFSVLGWASPWSVCISTEPLMMIQPEDLSAYSKCIKKLDSTLEIECGKVAVHFTSDTASHAHTRSAFHVCRRNFGPQPAPLMKSLKANINEQFSDNTKPLPLRPP